jgi:hypothetical protein
VTILYRVSGQPISSIFKDQEEKRIFLDFLTLENGTDKMSQNVSTELPLYAAQNSRRSQVSFTSQQKPEMTQNSFGFNEWCGYLMIVDC